MKILVLNAGSSSIKYALYDFSAGGLEFSGLVENIGENSALHHTRHKSSASAHVTNLGYQEYQSAFELVFTQMQENYHVNAIGHRVVHGGAEFHNVVKITPDILINLSKTIPLAPLHNPVNIKGIELAIQYFSDISQFAVFDTAYHHTLPPYASQYALPRDITTQFNIRRFGFHGISHSHNAKAVAIHMNKPLESLNLISLHLGNGASATAIAQGKSIDTSMGMTPMEGLVMGSRCGDLDPGVLLFLLRMGYDEPGLQNILNHESGLKGFCGSNDMREICTRAEQGQEAAKLAIDIYCYRVKKYIGAYTAVLGRVDALVFSGGIGENSAIIREKICEGLDNLGIAIDAEKNLHCNVSNYTIQKAGMPVAIFRIKSDEELEIATQVQQYISK